MSRKSEAIDGHVAVVTTNQRSISIRDQIGRTVEGIWVALFIFALVVLEIALFFVEQDDNAVAQFGGGDPVQGKTTILSLEVVINIAFSVEIILKMYAFGITYFRFWFNVFDFGVVLVSATGFATETLVKLNLPPGCSGGLRATGPVLVVRLLRFFRIIKVVKKVQDHGKIQKYNLGKLRGMNINVPVVQVLHTLQRLVREIVASPAVASGLQGVSLDDIKYVIKMVESRKLYELSLEKDEDSNSNEEETAADVEISSWLSGNFIGGGQVSKPDVEQDQAANSGSSDDSSSIQERIITSLATLCPSGSTENLLNKTVQTLHSWDFDVFELDRESNGHPAVFVAHAAFVKFDLVRKLKMDSTTFFNFVVVIEKGYQAIPYHNRVHAADVMQSVACFLCEPGIKEHLTPVEAFATLLAALCHDYDHPGTNNQFLINTLSPRAITYNDRSVLENYHVASAFNLVNDASINVFHSLSREQFKEVRDLMIFEILGTDMAVHFESLGVFQTKLAGNGFDMTDKTDRKAVLKMSVHCADVSNPAKAPTLAMQWTVKVMEEFYMQGDKERELGLTISGFMDRNKPSTATCQLSFINYIVGPLYEAWIEFLARDPIKETEFTRAAAAHLKANKEYWTKNPDPKAVDRSPTIATPKSPEPK